MLEILGHNYIGGARSAVGGIILNSHDASTGEALPYSFVQATAQEVDAAVQAAAAAYPAFRNLTGDAPGAIPRSHRRATGCPG